MQGKKGTGMYGMQASGEKIKQVPGRMPRAKWDELKAKLQKDGLKFQHLFDALIEGYMGSDQDLYRVIKEWQERNATRMTKEFKKQTALFRASNSMSSDEREDIMAEIEEESET